MTSPCSLPTRPSSCLNPSAMAAVGCLSSSKRTSSLNHWMVQEEKMCLESDCGPHKEMLGKDAVCAAEPPGSRSLLPRAEEWPCHQQGFALTPTIPKNGHRINFWRLASVHQHNCCTLEAQGTCASSSSEELSGEENPIGLFSHFQMTQGQKQRGLTLFLLGSRRARLNWGGCKSQVMLHDAFLLTELLVATVNKSVCPALHPK